MDYRNFDARLYEPEDKRLSSFDRSWVYGFCNYLSPYGYVWKKYQTFSEASGEKTGHFVFAKVIKESEHRNEMPAVREILDCNTGMLLIPKKDITDELFVSFTGDKVSFLGVNGEGLGTEFKYEDGKPVKAVRGYYSDGKLMAEVDDKEGTKLIPLYYKKPDYNEAIEKEFIRLLDSGEEYVPSFGTKKVRGREKVNAPAVQDISLRYEEYTDDFRDFAEMNGKSFRTMISIHKEVCELEKTFDAGKINKEELLKELEKIKRQLADSFVLYLCLDDFCDNAAALPFHLREFLTEEDMSDRDDAVRKLWAIQGSHHFPARNPVFKIVLTMGRLYLLAGRREQAWLYIAEAFLSNDMFSFDRRLYNRADDFASEELIRTAGLYLEMAEKGALFEGELNNMRDIQYLADERAEFTDNESWNNRIPDNGEKTARLKKLSEKLLKYISD